MITAQVNRLMIEVTRLSVMTTDVLGMLTAQQTALKVRGMQLPEGFLDAMKTIQEDVRHLQEVLGEQQPELAQLRALVRTMSNINSKLDLAEVLNDVMDTFVELTGAERGFIVLRDPVTREMKFEVARGMDQNTLNKGSFTISRTIVEEVATKGEPVITSNAVDDKRYSAQQSIVISAVRSIICVPLKIKDNIVGVAYSDHRYRKELFGEQEAKFLLGFANQAAVAIENARLYENVQKQLKAITEIRNFLDNIFSSIASGIITLDENGAIVAVNRAAETILGINTAESIGRSYRDVFPAFYEGFDNLLSDVRKYQKQQIVEINPVLPERGPVYITLKLSPLRSGEETLGVAIVMDDLTAIKQRDETLRVLNTYLSAEMVANIHSVDSLGLGGEDREISAVFADVRGFTTVSEKLDPQTLMSVINQYLSVSSDCIQITEGVIDKFMGDAVLGLYNTQLNPQTDHAERAVRSAIMMIRDVAELHQSLPPGHRLFYGIGIHTGPAVLGNVGSPSRKEFTAIGEAVVYAKKLQETAQGGEIILSEETYERVKHRFNCEAIERQLRGESEFHKMYKVVGMKH